MAKQHTDSVNFTRTVVVDNVTGEVITSGAGTTAGQRQMARRPLMPLLAQWCQDL
ncbi:mucin-binding protein [Limosilactobacillus fermentum]